MSGGKSLIVINVNFVHETNMKQCTLEQSREITFFHYLEQTQLQPRKKGTNILGKNQGKKSGKSCSLQEKHGDIYLTVIMISPFFPGC